VTPVRGIRSRLAGRRAQGATAPEPARDVSLPDGLVDDIALLQTSAPGFHAHLVATRQAAPQQVAWYPYEILGNLVHLDRLLHGANRSLRGLAGDRPVADIGAADGDLAFLVEHEFGWEVDIVDTATTNMNGLQAARILRELLGSQVNIEDIDLDAGFRLPRERYGLVFLLGILYHLQNPYQVLSELARHADHCLLSTRVARFAGERDTAVAELPVAYLVAPTETNNDPTNYWIFSPAGLERIVSRTGWTVLERYNVGATRASNPVAGDRDERAFLLLRSNLTT
jgi:2-polyprenyl-3-methyl-5-hydroxy-6-metoxy-1,4-benzoquinol methylase